MNHKAGFVTIIGYPNTGKSTLMNALVGEKLSITTPKAQTTRHRIMGIYTGDGFQIVYSDTPGILDPRYKLQSAMMSAVLAALEDADVILLVTEGANEFDHKRILEKLHDAGNQVIVVLNKMDLGNMQLLEKQVEHWQSILPAATILPVSALHRVNLDQVLKAILGKLPDSPAYYPDDELTDRTQRFFVSEIIREKILLNFAQEIPYSTEVSVESFREEEKITRISAVIHVARESQKAILLGHKGNAIRKLGTESRKDIESFIGQHIFLELTVKVAKDWREDDRALRRFGYTTE